MQDEAQADPAIVVNETPPEEAPRFDESIHSGIVRKPTGGIVLNVYSDKEKRNAYFWVEPSAPYFKLREDEISAALDESGIKIEPERRNEIIGMLDNHREAARAGTFSETLLTPHKIAETVDGKEGKNGWVEWEIDNPDPDIVRLSEDGSGRVDYREMHKVINVTKDAPLARVHPPEEGEVGEDIFGKVLEPKPVSEANLNGGNGVRFEDSDSTFYADIDGHVSLRSGQLTVDPVYMVNGDVDFSVGNVDFRGRVEVKNDVLEGFAVRATGDVIVGGVLSDGNIYSEADVVISGGITGKSDQGFVEAAGNMTTKYMLNSNMHVMGDVIVDSQIINSEIACAGKLVMPNGKLIGGSVLALGGIECAVIGADLGTQTELNLSLEDFSTSETRAIDHEMKNVQAEIKKLKRVVNDYLEDPTKLNALGKKRKEDMLEKVRNLKALLDKSGKLEEERQLALEPLKEKLNPEIIVHQRIYPGVEIHIGICRTTLAREIAGPIRLIPNYDRRSVTIAQYKP